MEEIIPNKITLKEGEVNGLILAFGL